MSLPHHYVQAFYKLLSLTNEFEVWFPIVGSCFFSTLFLLRSSQATPKGSHPFTKWLLGFMSANFLYLTSINICDRIYLARDDYSKQRPLADLGYFLIPMDARFQVSERSKRAFLKTRAHSLSRVESREMANG